MFLMQRPGAPKQEMGASEASKEAKSSKDRTQAVPAEGEGPAVAGTQCPPSDSKAPSDDDQKDAGSPAGTADKTKPDPDSPKSPKSPGTPSQKTADTEAAKLDRESNSRRPPSSTSRTGWERK